MNNFKRIRYNLIFIFIADALLYITNMGFASALFTPISLAAKFIALGNLIYIASKSEWDVEYPPFESFIFKLLLGWNLITIIRGGFSAADYWDWRFLFLYSLLFMLIPLAFFIGKNLVLARFSFYYVLNYLFKYGFLLIPLTLLTNPELYSRIMIPISFFILFIPYLKAKHRILILCVACTSVLLIVGFRTNIIKIVISLILLSTWYVRNHIGKVWFKIAHFLFFIIPVVLLFLATTGVYNVFSETSERNSGYTIKGNTGEDESFSADTRTFLFVEVFATLKANNSWLFGEGGVGKYKSEYFDYLVDSSRGRYGSEVGFLNTMLYSGIVGVVIYALILIVASYYGIYKSNNWLCKVLGVIIASRWMLYFVEEFTQFDMNFYFTWIIIGLVSSNTFRTMTDRQLNAFFSL